MVVNKDPGVALVAPMTADGHVGSAMTVTGLLHVGRRAGFPGMRLDLVGVRTRPTAAKRVRGATCSVVGGETSGALEAAKKSLASGQAGKQLGRTGNRSVAGRVLDRRESVVLVFRGAADAGSSQAVGVRIRLIARATGSGRRDRGTRIVA